MKHKAVIRGIGEFVEAYRALCNRHERLELTNRWTRVTCKRCLKLRKKKVK